ncbi:hypothetical protein [Streptomyces chattanoogensis]|uniref:Uncharacterized protein n=1 Tax=Streptomyces chattanoogensis TaxID=66876 RepID=A0A0N0XWH4_9ACTN|nr:hypothetical protein [Streptomyces chattanoogensis]KPC64064.1 hypothetical protein ADL29_13620 [Streptomyces chattanoogensis]
MPYAFPDDLLQAQRDWYAAYQQLATTENPSQTTVLRRTLQRLSVRITTHPYWTSIPGHAPAARMALKQQAWEPEQQRWPEEAGS